MKILFLLLALSVQASAQQAEQVFTLPLFRDGLYTRYSANAIPDGALSEALNVTLDEDVDGVVVARNGYAKYNTSALPNSKTVRGLWPFDASDGTKYMVAHTSETFYKTTGDGIWTAITGANNFSLTKDFDCVQTIGKFWCANGDTVFSWDGTSTATISGAPVGNLVGRFRNRVLVSGISGSKGRVRGSAELDGSDYVLQVPGVSTTPFNIAFGGADDGEEVTCLMGAFQDVFVVGKRKSLWGLYGFGRNDFQVRELSREVGCIENRSVQEKNNCLYWMSLRGIEKFCGASIERVSDPIRDKLDTIVATAGNARSALDTTQADFEAGNLTASGPGAPVSVTISAGSLVPSTSTRVDTSSSDFVGGTLTSVTTDYYTGALVLSTQTLTDAFTDGNYTSNPTWTVGGNDYWTVASARLKYDPTTNDDDYVGHISIASRDLNEGAWSYTLAMAKGAGDSLIADFIFSASGSNPDTASGYLFRTSLTGAAGGSCGTDLTENVCGTTNSLYRVSSGVLVLLSSAVTATGGGFPSSVTITKKGSAITASFTVGTLTATDSTYTTSSNIILRATSGISFAEAQHGYIVFDDITYPGFQTTGSFLSQIFDTSFSTPVYGPFSSTYTAYNSAGEGNIAFYVQSSSASDGGGFTAIATTSDTLRPTTLDGKRYFRYRADFSTSVSTKTPRLDAVSLGAATTGYFISQCRNPSSAITAWGLFTCTQDLNDGNLTYYLATGASCNAVTRTTATWNTQANNATISIGTAAYVAYRVLFSVTSSSQQPKVRDCTFNWTEGETRPPVASSVYLDRYYLAYTSSTAGSGNDHILVLDKNDKWTLFSNHNCYSMANYERKLYCGSSTNAGQVWRLDIGTDDDGTAITSRIRTKAFHFGMPEARKSFRSLYMDLEPSPDPTQTITLTGRYTLERSTPTYSLGNVDLNEDPGSIMTSKFPFPLENPITGRYIQIDLESFGFNSPWRLFSGRLYYTPMTPE